MAGSASDLERESAGHGARRCGSSHRAPRDLTAPAVASGLPGGLERRRGDAIGAALPRRESGRRHLAALPVREGRREAIAAVRGLPASANPATVLAFEFLVVCPVTVPPAASASRRALGGDAASSRSASDADPVPEADARRAGTSRGADPLSTRALAVLRRSRSCLERAARDSCFGSADRESHSRAHALSKTRLSSFREGRGRCRFGFRSSSSPGTAAARGCTDAPLRGVRASALAARGTRDAEVEVAAYRRSRPV